MQAYAAMIKIPVGQGVRTSGANMDAKVFLDFDVHKDLTLFFDLKNRWNPNIQNYLERALWCR